MKNLEVKLCREGDTFIKKIKIDTLIGKNIETLIIEKLVEDGIISNMDSESIHIHSYRYV